MNERGFLQAYFAIPLQLSNQVRKAFAAFFLLVMIGFVTGMMRPGSLDSILIAFTDNAASAGLYQLEGGALLATILANNLLAALIAIAAGLIPFVPLAALTIGLNALMFGAFGAYYHYSGLGIAAYLAGTLPHAIVEIPALMIACGAGLYLSIAVTGGVLGRVTGHSVASVLGICLRVYIHWVIPLMAVSAFFETYVTPRIFEQFI